MKVSIQETPLVSVVIPTYNRAETICDAVGSVLSQEHQNLEVIVVDDGSDDGTETAIRAIDDSRVSYIYQENSGACSARNKGVSVARGSLIAFQDSDDLWRPGKLSAQVRALNEGGYDAVFCKMLSHGTNGSENYVPSNRQIRQGLDFQTLLKGNFISTQMLLVRKSVMEEVKFDEALPRLQDWDLAIRLMSKFRVGYVDSCLVDQYIRSDSISSNPEKLVSGLTAIVDKYGKVYEKHPDSLSEVLYGLSEAYVALGQKSLSIEYAKGSYRIDKSPITLLRLMKVMVEAVLT